MNVTTKVKYWKTKKDYASNNVFGIDYDPHHCKGGKSVSMFRSGEMGDPIFVGDGLNDLNWSDDTRSKFQIIKEGKRHPRQFNIIATNPIVCWGHICRRYLVIPPESRTKQSQVEASD